MMTTLAFFEALSKAQFWQFALTPMLLCVFIGAAGPNDGSKKQELKTSIAAFCFIGAVGMCILGAFSMGWQAGVLMGICCLLAAGLGAGLFLRR